MGAEFTDESLMRSLVATLLSVYEEVRVYRPSNTTVLYMASDTPMQAEHELAQTRAAFDRAPRHYGRVGLSAPEDLVAALAMETADAKRFSEGSALITDDDNRLATANVYERKRGMDGVKIATLLTPYDPVMRSDSFIYREIANQISFEYLWRRIVLWSGGGEPALERASKIPDYVGDTDVSLLMRYMMAQHLKEPEIAKDFLAKGLARWPNSVPLLYADVESEMGVLVAGKASEGVARSAAKLSGEPAMVLAATRAATRQEWDSLAQADEQLAQIPWTAQWGLQAQQLRGEWRMRVKNPELRQVYGDEGIAIADRAEVTQPDVFWHSLRAWSAVGTNRPEVIVESVAAFCLTAQQVRPKLLASERALVHARAVALQPILAKIQGDSRIDSERYEVIRVRLDEVVKALE
jgi:hypothetical protein